METLQNLLNTYSTDGWFIEHANHQINHVQQALVGLHRMGSTPEQMANYAKLYVNHMEDAKLWKRVESIERPENMDVLIGLHVNFYHLVAHYEEKLKNEYGGSIKKFVNGEFPRFSLGVVSALFHAVIHLGHGIAACNNRMVCEGLALIHFAYKAPKNLSDEDQKRLQIFSDENGTDPLKWLDQIRNDDEINAAILKDPENHPPPGPGYLVFNYRIGKLFQYKMKELIGYANSLAVPKWAQANAVALANYLVELTTIVYAGSEVKNDFFLLHGVTTAWSLRKVVEILDDEKESKKTIKMFLITLIGAFIIQGTPMIDPKHAEVGKSWDEIIKFCLAEDDRDEHVYKVVQCSYDMCKEMPGHNENLYKSAALIGLGNPLGGFAHKDKSRSGGKMLH